MGKDGKRQAAGVPWSKEDGQKLRKQRLKLGMSLTELAGLVGVDRSSVNRWENGLVSHCNALHNYVLTQFMNGAADLFDTPSKLFRLSAEPLCDCTAEILDELEKIRLMLHLRQDQRENNRILLKELRKIVKWMVEERF